MSEETDRQRLNRLRNQQRLAELRERDANSFKPGLGDYVQQIVGQGAAMGFGDEISAAVRAGYQAATEGKSFGEAYDEAITQVRGDMAKTEEYLGPAATIGLQAAGGLATGGIGAGRSMAMTGARMLPKLAKAAKVGAIQGGITGAGMSEGGLIERAKGAALGSTVGATAAPLLLGGTSAAIRGAKGAIAPFVPGGAKRQAAGLLRVSSGGPETASRMASEMADMPPRAVLADVAPTDMRRVAGEAARRVGGGDAAEMLAQRHRGQYERFTSIVDELVSNKTSRQMVERLSDARRVAAREQYGKLYDTPIGITDEMKKLFNTDTGREGWKLAQKLASNEGIELPALYDDNGKLVTMVDPNMEILDLWKRGMDGVVEASYKESGALGTSAKSVRDRLRNHLDDLIPEYKEVRSTYAGFSAALDAEEKGRAYMRTSMMESGNLDKIVDASDIKEMGGHELEAFRAGMASVLRDQLANKPRGANLAGFFDKPAIEQKLKSALGDDFAEGFLDQVQKEAQMAATYAETQGSQTAQRIATGNTMDRPAGLVSDIMYQNYGNLLTRAADAVSTQPEATAKVLSGLLLSPDPAKQAVAIRMMKGNPLLRIADQVPAYASGAIASGTGYGAGRASSQEDEMPPMLLRTK